MNDPRSSQYAPDAGRQPDRAGRLLHARQAVAQRRPRSPTSTWPASGRATDTIALYPRRPVSRERFHSRNSNLVPAQVPVTALPSGVTVAEHHHAGSPVWTICSVPARRPAGSPSTRTKWRDVFNFADMDFCGVECGAAQSQILEKVHKRLLACSRSIAAATGASRSRWRYRRALCANGSDRRRPHSCQRPPPARRSPPSVSAIRWIATTATRCRR